MPVAIGLAWVACLAVASARVATPQAVVPVVAVGAGPQLRVPHACGAIVLDGDTDDPGWLAAPGPARTGPFTTATGAPARPHAEARFLWGDGVLYALLYAADEDVRSAGDAFVVTFARREAAYTIAIAADGTLRSGARDRAGRAVAWRSGAHVARELDGTLDDARDVDEEWSLEIAVPLASLGLEGASSERVALTIERRDASAKESASPSGRFRGEIVLEPR